MKMIYLLLSFLVAATDYDINLPLKETPGVECRSGAIPGGYEIVVTLANLLSTMGSVTASAPAQVQGFTLSNEADLTASLAGVPNAQTTTLHDVHNGDVVVPISVLIGDISGNGAVTGTDVSQAKFNPATY